VSKWYQAQDGNEEDGDDSDGVVKWKKAWTMRKVVQVMKKAEINNEVGEAAGHPAYMRGYVRAVNEVISQLTDQEKREYTDMAKEWNKSRPPKEVQIL
jgi:hypothetical protein